LSVTDEGVPLADDAYTHDVLGCYRLAIMIELPSTDVDLDRLPTDGDLGRLQLTTLLYYLHCTNPDNGLVRDKTEPNAPASIAAIGMAMATFPVVVERGIIVREFAAKITRKRLQYLMSCPQGPEPDSSGYKGFCYHFLDIETGRRVWQCELSTIDSAFLIAGALTAATYFDRDTPDEAEIRQLAMALYERAGLELGQGRGCDFDAWLASGKRLHPLSVAWLRRGAAALYHRSWLSDPSIAARELRGIHGNIRMAKYLWPRNALFRTSVHTSAVAYVDRLSRHPGRVHAPA
jgi:hypothetical protein